MESAGKGGARALMVQGTCSGAGKSLLVAGLARILADEGVRVAPFKSQNMALNSFITAEGAEIGRAQALQAEAARIEPHALMNPILLKAQGEKGCQVVMNGKVHGSMSAREYYAFKHQAWQAVCAAYEELRRRYEVILIEGAGSPAEINLADDEIVNMRMARHADCPVLLAGDIDRGGVFASFYGTVGLLDGDAERIKGFVVNKFRGDLAILEPGLRQIEKRTAVPVVGVIPWLRDLGLDEEDGLSLADFGPGSARNPLKAVVVRLNSISNFTDFGPLACEPDVDLVFSASPRELLEADLLIVPGSKNTLADMRFLWESGLAAAIRAAAAQDKPVIGICGGYQMLGRRIADPLLVEGTIREIEGLGLLDIETVMEGEKVTCQTEGKTDLFGTRRTIRGYEIHMGRTSGETGLFACRRLPGGETVRDGARRGPVWGTYLHGLFDNDGFRNDVLNRIRAAKGLPFREQPVAYAAIKEKRLDRWADLLRRHLDLDFIRRLLP